MDIEQICKIGTSLGVPLMRLGRDDIQIAAEDMARAALPEGTTDWRTWCVYGEYRGTPECYQHYECTAPGPVRIVSCEMTHGYPRQDAPITEADIMESLIAWQNEATRQTKRAELLAGQAHAATLALDNIHAAMSGKVWDAETMTTVANILAETGRTVAEPPEYDEDGYSEEYPRCPGCEGGGMRTHDQECGPCKGTGYEGGNTPPEPEIDDDDIISLTPKGRAAWEAEFGEKLDDKARS